MESRFNASIAFVGTYAPTVCGIATYTGSLIAALAADANRPRRVAAVSLTDRPMTAVEWPVVFHHRPGDPASRRKAVGILNGYDSVSVQHEFGIFGPRDGAEVLELLEELTVPTAVTLHTVLREPSASQRVIIEGIGHIADRIVVMSETASDRLTACYDVDPGLIRVIPHGADPGFAGPSRATGSRPLVLTWGLIGPGKGLELAIEAFADLVDLDPLPRYLIAGATHPEVRRNSGEAYRRSLIGLTSRLGIGDLVTFDDRFLTRTALAALVRSADLVVLPYESVEQVTSGVLAEAIAASKPVIATRFPHAVEVLSDGAGLLVPHDEPEALSAALRKLLSDGDAMAAMTQQARKMAAEWYWPTVGRRFADMMAEISGVKETVAAASASIAG
ncbi:MAG TPA: glycosyltransferase [Acidimicrobiia bacterium]|nr:glycosyltransferase [Acidimicrobiia bacterium]